MDAYVGQIILWASPRVPSNWFPCDGRTLSVSQYQALFTLLGTTYGGDGKSTFGLPKLAGALPIGTGQGTGLTNRTLGQTGGATTVSLAAAEIPAHSHSLMATQTQATQAVPSASLVLAATPSGYDFYFNPPATGAPTPVEAASQAVTFAGGGQSHDNLMPFTTIQYLICVNGLFPSKP